MSRLKAATSDAIGIVSTAYANDQLLEAMMAYPILINRPIVVSPKGVKLCRPSEEVLDLLPPQRARSSRRMRSP